MKKVFTFLLIFSFAAIINSQDWTAVTSGITGDIWGIDYADANVVWATANNGQVTKSVDGGTTWTACAGSAGDGAYAICALNDMAAVVATGPGSGSGKIVKTTDGGATWTQVYTATGAWFNFIDNISETELWAQSDPIGGNFHIVRSTDGGATWTQIATPVPAPATNVFGAVGSFYRIGNVCWFGTGGSSATLANRVYKSVNGPEGPWTFGTTSAQYPGTIAFSSVDGMGVTGFWNQTTKIDRTTDGGAAWAAQVTAIGGVGGMEYIPNTSSTFAATTTGIWKSADDGITWTQSQVATNLNVLKAFGDQNVALAGGNAGVLYKSAMPSLFPYTFTHNTGDYKLTAFNDGYIGHNFDASLGQGLVYMGKPDAMFTAGMMFGTPATGVVGMVGSFTEGSVPIILDLENSAPLVGPTSDPTFDQITNTAFTTKATSPLSGMVYQEVLSKTGDSFVLYHYTLVNNSGSQMSDTRIGIFADLDVSGANYALNRGGVDAARNLVYQFLNMTTPNDPNYYGIVALNGLSGAKLSSVFPGTALTLRNEIFTYISSVDLVPVTTNGDYRTYAACGPYTIPVGGNVEVWFALVAGTNLANLQANADLAIQKYSLYVPVELTSFTAASVNGSVQLNWSTATEVNNRGFEIERRSENGNFVAVAFVNGNGTSSENQNYSFTDTKVEDGKYFYRLKQVDFNGRFEYSDEVEVTVTSPVSFALEQNYPNPFNPSTMISYSIPEAGFIKLAVYNILGQEVAVLVNGVMEAGNYRTAFDASSLSTGTYFYKLDNGQQILVKKMMLIK